MPTSTQASSGATRTSVGVGGVGDGRQRRRVQVSATLSLTREGFGIELRRGTFNVEVDGTSLGSVELHETFQAPVEAGNHTLRIRAGRYSSRERSFDAADRETISFRCHGANIWPLYVASLVKPDLAIGLKRQ
jgi:hypothetical protein